MPIITYKYHITYWFDGEKKPTVTTLNPKEVIGIIEQKLVSGATKLEVYKTKHKVDK